MRRWVIRACLLVALAPVWATVYHLTTPAASRLSPLPTANTREAPARAGRVSAERADSILYSPRQRRLVLHREDGRSALVDTTTAAVVRWFDFVPEPEGRGSLLCGDRVLFLVQRSKPEAWSWARATQELEVYSLSTGKVLRRRTITPDKPREWREFDHIGTRLRRTGRHEVMVGYWYVFFGGGGRPTAIGGVDWSFKIDLQSLEVTPVADASDIGLAEWPDQERGVKPSAEEPDGALIYDNTRVSLRRGSFEPVQLAK
jgi:hypothetical protein